MTTEQQRETLTAALAVSRTLHDDDPNAIFFLVSEGRNGRYHIIDIAAKVDRHQLLANFPTHIRATITDNCIPQELTDELIAALQSDLDVAYSPNGKTSNAYDLGDFITRAQQSISATA